eukprot:6787347-Ditylum_brightwellii.AAC.1
MGKQIQVTLSQAQLISGSAFPYFSEVKGKQSYVPSSWLGSVRSFLARCNGKIMVKDEWLPKIQQANNRDLMDVFVEKLP